ncbi:MAG: hypothetical protein JWP11_844 [Frankiales bacterium]|nr:hypothetical protein [Frankiales bacterium]
MCAALAFTWSVRGAWISWHGGRISPTAFATDGGAGDAALWVLLAVVPLTALAWLTGLFVAGMTDRLVRGIDAVRAAEPAVALVTQLAVVLTAATLAVCAMIIIVR